MSLYPDPLRRIREFFGAHRCCECDNVSALLQRPVLLRRSPRPGPPQGGRPRKVRQHAAGPCA